MFSIFDFGANWEEFSKRRVDRQRLELACESLQSSLEQKKSRGKEFSRRGLSVAVFSSIAAHRLRCRRKSLVSTF